MKVAVWYTGHPICDTVAKSLARGFDAILYHTNDLNDDLILGSDCHIAYGILRGTKEVFRRAQSLGRPWFNVDRGYFNPGHYDGTYRISYRGTQAKWPADRVPLAVRQDALALVCPPTPDVCDFFDIDARLWLQANLTKNCLIKYKSDGAKIPWDRIGLVKTFNSSLGWEALKRGIPCVSDSNHSVIGSYYNYLDSNKEMINIDTEQLFAFMVENQFTLKEIESGKAEPLIKRHMIG